MRVIVILTLAHLALTSHISVLSPQTLIDQFADTQNQLVNNLANFGDSTNEDGCAEFDPYDRRGDPDEEFSPIFMALRGGCTFVQKARRAQNAGAKVLLIQNNQPNQNIQTILLSDDGTARDITIATLMITYEQGATLRTYLSKDQRREKNFVTLKASFDVWQSDEVKYDIYFAASQMYFYDFLKEMNKFHKLLNETTPVTPHFRVHSFSRGDLEKNLDCYANGKYCLFNDIQATGRQILTEQIRQICILEKHTTAPKIEEWFEYVSAISQKKCQIEDTDCISDSMKAAGIDETKVEDCVIKAFQTDSSTNSTVIPLLDAEIQEWYRTWNPMLYPAVTINNVYYRGNLEGEDVFRMICASYKQQPDGCTQYFQKPVDPEPTDPTREEGTGGSGGGGLSVGAIIGIILAIIVVNVIVICCYRRYHKRELNRQLQTEVNSAVSAYFKLQEGEKQEP